jgi:hypothetical protein
MVFNTAFNNISVISKFEDTKGVIRSRKSKDRQWSKEKAQRDKQWCAKHYKERATRASLKSGDEVRCSGRVGDSCSTRGIRRVTLVINLLINYENRRNKYWTHSCSTRGIRRATLVTNPLINYENRRNKYWSHPCSTRGIRRVTLVINLLINYENWRNQYWSHSCSTRGIRRVTFVANRGKIMKTDATNIEAIPTRAIRRATLVTNRW